MIAIGSAAAAPATPLRPLAAASAGPAQDTAAASALLDQIASRTRDSVSTRDLGALMATLQPALNDTGPRFC